MGRRILLIEDDVNLIKYIEEYLNAYDYVVETIKDFNNVEKKIFEGKSDLILLDINLPKFDGFYFLKLIRKKLNIPVIIVSSRSEEAEQIRGIDLGADDYITKPFSIGILLAKINAVLRRTSSVNENIIEVNKVKLYCEGMEIITDNKSMSLSKNEYKLLKIFFINYEKVVTREELLEELWDEDEFVDDNTLTVNITRLKKRIKENNIQLTIETKRGLAMSLSKLVGAVLKKEKASIFIYLFSCFSIMLFYYFLYNEKFMLYPVLLCFFCLMVYLVYKLCVYNSFYKSLKEIKTSPSYNLDKNSDFEDVFDDIREIHNDYISKIYALETNYEEKEKLLIQWVHNMKTSVAVINLAIEKFPNEDATKDIRNENSLLQKNLEGVLNIFRLGEFSKDYVPEAINLKKLVKESINSQKRNFIYSNIYPEVNIPEDYFILSDKKWGKYVIEQIISNAIKYSLSGGKVCFYAEESDCKITLYIQDFGVGIKKEEICRVFDVFFTGSNGRKEEKSSGIGLYMCKSICDNLNNKIYITSQISKGTIVSITYLKQK